MVKVLLTEQELEMVAGGYPVCTVQDGGIFTPAGGTTFNYSSFTLHSNGSTTFNIVGGGQWTTAPITDPYLRGLYLNQYCGTNND